MQDINKSEYEREIKAITNTRDLFGDLSNMLYVLAFTAMKDFHYALSFKITQHYKFSQKPSDPQVLYSFPQKPNTRTCMLAPRSQPSTT